MGAGRAHAVLEFGAGRKVQEMSVPCGIMCAAFCSASTSLGVISSE